MIIERRDFCAYINDLFREDMKEVEEITIAVEIRFIVEIEEIFHLKEAGCIIDTILDRVVIIL